MKTFRKWLCTNLYTYLFEFMFINMLVHVCLELLSSNLWKTSRAYAYIWINISVQYVLCLLMRMWAWLGSCIRIFMRRCFYQCACIFPSVCHHFVKQPVWLTLLFAFTTFSLLANLRLFTQEHCQKFCWNWMEEVACKQWILNGEWKKLRKKRRIKELINPEMQKKKEQKKCRGKRVKWNQ